MILNNSFSNAFQLKVLKSTKKSTVGGSFSPQCFFGFISKDSRKILGMILFLA